MKRLFWLKTLICELVSCPTFIFPQDLEILMGDHPSDAILSPLQKDATSLLFKILFPLQPCLWLAALWCLLYTSAVLCSNFLTLGPHLFVLF